MGHYTCARCDRNYSECLCYDEPINKLKSLRTELEIIISITLPDTKTKLKALNKRVREIKRCLKSN